MKKIRAGHLVSGLIVLLALTGCVRFQAELSITPEDTVNGEVIVAVVVGGEEGDRDAAADAAVQIEQELLPNLRGAQGVTQEEYDEDGYLGSRLTFSHTPLDSFAGGGDGSISIERDGDEFTFSGRLDFTPDSEEVPEDADTSNISVRVTFPGEVLQSNGEVSGNTVTWTTSMEERIDMDARGSAEASGLPAWVWLIAIGAVLAAAAVILVVVLRRNRAADAQAM